MNRIFILLAATGLLLGGCGTTDPNSPKGRSVAKVRQLHVGMSSGQVERLFGNPTKVDQDDEGYHHGYGYVPYYGYRRGGWEGAEMTYEYKHLDLEVKFRRSGSRWVVKEWDQD